MTVYGGPWRIEYEGVLYHVLSRGKRATGHLFYGRFKSILVENDAYVLELSCYIHRNPLRAGMGKRSKEILIQARIISCRSCKYDLVLVFKSLKTLTALVSGGRLWSARCPFEL